MAFWTEIISITGGGNYQVKISSTDTTGNYLINKLVAGANITIIQNNPGSNETLTINGDFINLTTTQRLALTPYNGLTVFDTTLNAPMIYVNGGWGTILLN